MITMHVLHKKAHHGENTTLIPVMLCPIESLNRSTGRQETTGIVLIGSTTHDRSIVTMAIAKNCKLSINELEWIEVTVRHPAQMSHQPTNKQ